MPIHSHCLRGQRRGCVAARVMELSVRIPPGPWKSVYCECCILSGGGISAGLITRPEEYYRLWCARVWLWSLDNEGAWADHGCLRHVHKFKIFAQSSNLMVTVHFTHTRVHQSFFNRERGRRGSGLYYTIKDLWQALWNISWNKYY